MSFEAGKLDFFCTFFGSIFGFPWILFNLINFLLILNNFFYKKLEKVIFI
jgi:hypothetical protein